MGVLDIVVGPLPCEMVCPSMSKAPGEEGIAAMAWLAMVVVTGGGCKGATDGTTEEMVCVPRTRLPLELYATGVLDMSTGAAPCEIVWPSTMIAPGAEGIAATT